MNNIVNTVAYLRTSREFPEELHQLTVEVNKAYIDIANVVNNRIISLFPLNRPAITGENWFLNDKQQTLRQVYAFTSITAITHNINGSAGFRLGSSTRVFGTYTDGTNDYGLIFGTNGGPIPNQISFYITKTQIIFIKDAGAPALSSGRIVIEWLSSI